MCRERYDDEQGIALISVMLAVLILSGLVTVFVSRAVTETTVSRHSKDRETAIHVAEAGTDKQLAAINVDNLYATLDESGSPVTLDLSGYPSEKAWAADLLDRMDGAPDAWVDTANGEAFAVRPVDSSGVPLDVVFGVGAVPAFGDPDARTRVVKLQVAQDFFSPDYAIMTNGDLKFGGNAEVVAPRCDPANPVREDCNADIHVNQSFSTSGGSHTVQGRVSVAGAPCPSTTATFGCQGSDSGVDDQPVPEIRARNFYGRELGNLNPDQEGQPMDWFDLCPDGTVRPVSSSGPCTNPTVIWPDPTTPEGSTTSFRGWKFKDVGGGKSWNSTAVGAGVFYVYHADASINGSDGSLPRAVSVFVEANPSDLSRTGSLSVSGNPRMESAYPDVLIVTDADLDLSGNSTVSACGATPEAMSGFISVREQFKTIGTVELRGAVVIQDAADDHNLVARSNAKIQGTMCLEFDENLDIDIEGHFTITFWNEL